jgi:hypothetical protein
LLLLGIVAAHRRHPCGHTSGFRAADVERFIERRAKRTR